MKPRILPTVLLAIAGLTFSPGIAKSQTYSTTTVAVSGSGNDLFLGFEESGNGYNLIADIGPDTNYINATSAFTIQFGVVPPGESGSGTAVTNLNADLTNLFGSWTTSSGSTALKWGVIGDDENGSVPLLFLTRDSANPAKPTNSSYDQIGNYTDAVDSLSSTLATDRSTANSTKAANVPSTSTLDNPNSWSGFNPYTNAFGTGYNIEQSPGDGPLSTLNLFEDIPNATGAGSEKDLGTFTLGQNGAVTFTPASIPEPSTWVAIVDGSLFLGFFRLRRPLRVS